MAIDLTILKNSLAVKGARIFCMEPDLPDGATAEQVAAGHLCKHEMLSALWRFYAVCPPDMADKIMSPPLKKLMLGDDSAGKKK